MELEGTETPFRPPQLAPELRLVIPSGNQVTCALFSRASFAFMGHAVANRIYKEFRQLYNPRDPFIFRHLSHAVNERIVESPSFVLRCDPDFAYQQLQALAVASAHDQIRRALRLTQAIEKHGVTSVTIAQDPVMYSIVNGGREVEEQVGRHGKVIASRGRLQRFACREKQRRGIGSGASSECTQEYSQLTHLPVVQLQPGAETSMLIVPPKQIFWEWAEEDGESDKCNV